MATNELSFLLHHSVNGVRHTMMGGIEFINEITVDENLINDKEFAQKCRYRVASMIVDNIIAWLKEEFPYALQSYIDMAARDQAWEYLRLPNHKEQKNYV